MWLPRRNECHLVPGLLAVILVAARCSAPSVGFGADIPKSIERVNAFALEFIDKNGNEIDDRYERSRNAWRLRHRPTLSHPRRSDTKCAARFPVLYVTSVKDRDMATVLLVCRRDSAFAPGSVQVDFLTADTNVVLRPKVDHPFPWFAASVVRLSTLSAGSYLIRASAPRDTIYAMLEVEHSHISRQ